MTRVLARRERSHIDWVKALHAATAKVSHRASPLSLEALWRLVESPRAEPLARAAAAIALEPKLAREDRARLRIAAEATASPRLRIALDRVAEGADEEALAEALAAVETGEPRRHRVL